jgi:hypothetical protein
MRMIRTSTSYAHEHVTRLHYQPLLVLHCIRAQYCALHRHRSMSVARSRSRIALTTCGVVSAH